MHNKRTCVWQRITGILHSLFGFLDTVGLCMNALSSNEATDPVLVLTRPCGICTVPLWPLEGVTDSKVHLLHSAVQIGVQIQLTYTDTTYCVNLHKTETTYPKSICWMNGSYYYDSTASAVLIYHLINV